MHHGTDLLPIVIRDRVLPEIMSVMESGIRGHRALAAVISEAIAAVGPTCPNEPMNHLLEIASRSGLNMALEMWQTALGERPNLMGLTSFALTFLLFGWDARGAVEDFEKFRELVTK